MDALCRTDLTEVVVYLTSHDVEGDGNQPIFPWEAKAYALV